MPPREDDDVAPRPGAPSTQTLTLVGGFVLAAAATLAVFLTDNAQYLRVAVVAVAWAFVLATVAAGRRATDQVAAAAREEQLHRAYEHELDREVAARREYELELENDLRREAEGSMRYELEALRRDIAELTVLREEVARVSALRGDIADLSSLRDDVARVAQLRDDVARVAHLREDVAGLASLRDEVARIAAMGEDVAELSSLRRDLGQLAELRADMGRLRAELTEQLSSELFIERIVMRTQAGRVPVDSERADAPGRPGDGRLTEGTASWRDDDVPPRELTGGWPAIQLDEPRETRQFEPVRVERTGVRPPVPTAGPEAWRPGDRQSAERRPWDEPATASWETVDSYHPPTSAFPAAGRDPWTGSSGSVHDDETPPWSAAQESTGSGARHSAQEFRPPPTPPTAAFPMATPGSARPAAARPTPHKRPRPAAPPQTTVSPIAPPAPARPAVAPEPLPSPMEWLAARSVLDPSSSVPARPDGPTRPEVPPRRRRDDDEPVAPAEAVTTQRPAVPPPVRVDDRGGYRVAVREEQPADPPTSPGREKRLADILAENGVSPATAGRRRRRYREEDEPDDVLSRVLRNN